VNYSIIEIPNINGTLISNGTDGWYKIEINNTLFIDCGNYNVYISAFKLNHRIASIIIPITILERPTLINDKEKLNIIQENIYIGDMINFTFSYIDLQTNETIINLNNQTYQWKIYDPSGNFNQKWSK